MEKKRKPRTDVKALMCAVLDILRERTDEGHPLTATEIRAVLKREYELEPDRDTVAGVLNTLLEGCHGFEQVRRKEYPREEDDPRREYPGGYYMTRALDEEEVEMLLNDVMFSRMRTQEQAKTLIKKLKGLMGPYHKKDLAYVDFLPFSLYTANKLVQENIAFVQRVVSGNLHNKTREKVISFCFNGYGSDHELHEVPEGQYRDFLPLKVFEAYGSYYVMGLMDATSTPWNFRLDLMTKLSGRERDKVKDTDRERTARLAAGADSLATYLTQHLYMAYEQKGEGVEAVYLRVEKIPYKPQASLTILHDAFGRHYNVRAENDRYIDVRVEGVLWGIAAFVRQNMDRVRVTGPDGVKEKVEAMLKADYQKYFQEPYGG